MYTNWSPFPSPSLQLHEWRRANTAREEDASTPSLDVGRQYGVKDYSHQLLLLLHALCIRLATQEQGLFAGFTFDNFNCSGHLLCYQAVIFRPPDDLTGVESVVGDFKLLD